MIQGINGKFQGVFNMLKMPDKALNAENNMSAFSAASVNTVSGTTPAQRAEDAKLQEMIHNARTSILAKSVNTAELSKQAKKISKLLENSVVGQLPRVGLFIETEVDAIGKYTELILDRSFSELSNCKDKSEVQNCVQRAMQEIQKEILKGKIYIKRGYKAIELDKKLSPIYNDPDKTKLVQGINIERIINALTSEPNVAEDTLPAAEAGLDSQVTSRNYGIGLDDAGDDPVIEMVDKFLDSLSELSSDANSGVLNLEFFNPEVFQNQNDFNDFSSNSNLDLHDETTQNIQNTQISKTANMMNRFSTKKIHLVG